MGKNNKKKNKFSKNINKNNSVENKISNHNQANNQSNKKKLNNNNNIKKNKVNEINLFERISIFYKNYYKFLLLIPLLLLVFSFISINSTLEKQGSIIYRDISLKGGVSAIVNVNTDINQVDISNYLNSNYPNNSFRVSELFSKGKRIGFIVDTDMKSDFLKKTLSNYFKVDLVDGKNYNANVISESLSSSFFAQAVRILLVSFVLMSLVIFLYFREFVPAGAVVLSGLFDLIVTIGMLDYFNVRIGIAGVGALLMLIGYSIDTDVLLTNRLVKERGDNYFEKAFDAFKTGSLMSLTTLSAGLIAFYLTNSNVIFQISLILVIGLLVDYISTWIQNTGLLLWYFNSKNN